MFQLDSKFRNSAIIGLFLFSIGALVFLAPVSGTGAIRNALSLSATSTPATAASVVIAASDSSFWSKLRADYVADGTNDEQEIITAMNDLSAVGGGSIVLLEGTFNIDSEIRTSQIVKHWPNGITIRGQGGRTILHNRMNGGTTNDRYTMDIWGNSSDLVSSIGIFDLKIVGDEYTADTMSQHGILLKYVRDVRVDNVYFENLSEEGLVIGPGAERVSIGAVFGKNLGSGVIDISGAGTRHINIQDVVGEAIDQVEDSAVVSVFDFSGGIPENVNIGSIHAIRPGSKGFQVISANNVNVNEIVVECESTGSRKSINAIQIYKNTGAQPRNINIGQVIARNCGARANNSSVSLQGDYININQVIIERPYGHGLSADNLHYSHIGQVIVHDATDTGTSAYTAVTLASNSTDNTFDQVLVRGWSYAAANGIGVAISGQRNIFGKIQVAGDAGVVGADSWDVWVASGASNNIIESAILSGHGTGGLSNNASSTRLGKIIKATNGLDYKPYQNSGTGTIAASTTSTTITHGLGFTPTAQNIIITPTNNPANDPGNTWINSITATTFNVNSRNDPGIPGLSFTWQVVVP